MDSKNNTTSIVMSFNNDIKTFYGVIFSLLGIVGTFGNLFIIIVYTFKLRRRFERLELLMKTIAYGDLCSSVVNSLSYLYLRVISPDKWHLGEFGCKFIPVLGASATTFTTFIIIVMTLDRDRAIVTPLKAQLTLKTIRLCIVCSLVISALCYTPYIMALELKNGMCHINITKSVAISGIIFQASMNITFTIVLSATSYRLIREFKFRKRRKVSTTTNRCHRLDYSANRLLKTVIAVDVSFVVCTFPMDYFVIYDNLRHILPGHFEPIPNSKFVFNVGRALNVSNSCVNIFLYCIVNPLFRKDVIDLFSRTCRHSK